MKKLVLFLAMLLTAMTVKAEDPAINFVDGLTDKILAEVVTAQKTQDEKERLFHDAFTEAVDLKGVGQFVLGTAWKKSSEEERNGFLNAFTDLTVKTWADRFNMYTGQQIVFQGTRNAERGQIYVDSVIQDKQPVEVIWRLRPSKESYKIVDIVVEGVSMASTYRNDYRAFLQQNGNSVQALTDELARKSREFKSENKNN
ncbi:MAG: ABC transporter substrate-binding protein [Alphaproteobacteria bacterium]|nr:ABC transporter substrate-binding protein [Alphaproteobacteria bacterium]